MVTDPFDEARAEDVMLALAEERFRERQAEEQAEDQFLAKEERIREAGSESAPAFSPSDLPF